MKKYLFPITLSLIIGSIMAYVIISRYDNLDTITVSNTAEKIYYLERGKYKNKEEMEKNMEEFEHYIYNVEDNMYYTYIGITQSKKNAQKLQEFYKEKGYNIEIKEKITDNKNFVKILTQYDEILSKTDNKEVINTICTQILSKYEEMINGEY